jgi:energy-coupling factor transporter ATP-binding protein EcfA2
MRILAGVDRPDDGLRLEGHNVVFDYFAQNQAEVLNPSRTVQEEMSAASSLTMAHMIRTILGGFLFAGDDVFKKVAVLSGGERNRLALAKMLLKASNVLLLDEPTNHLDLDSKEILLEALAAYGGTLIFVSHDRYFVDKLASKVIEVGGGCAPLYPGGYEDFLYWKKQREAGVTTGMPVSLARRRDDEEDGTASVATTTPAAAAPLPPHTGHGRPVSAAPGTGSRTTRGSHGPRPKSTAAAAAGQAAAAPGPNGQPQQANPLAPRLRPASAAPERQTIERELKRLKTRLAELEKRVTEREQAVKELEARMAAPGFYDDRARAAEAAEQHQKLMWDTGEAMAEWEALQTEVDTKGRQLAALAPPPRRQ